LSASSGMLRGMTMFERVEPPQVGDERAMLPAYLDYHRATLEMKCSGLTDDQLRERSVAASSLSLLGLVRHLTEVERSWFQARFARTDAPPIYFSDDNLDGDFDDLDFPDVAQVFATYREACEQSRRVVARAGSLDDLGVRGDGSEVTLRWILLHMLEEYARHNGHADLLRQSIDGATGE
jgi:Protein of unknown function (DUF664)